MSGDTAGHCVLKRMAPKEAPLFAGLNSVLQVAWSCTENMAVLMLRTSGSLLQSHGMGSGGFAYLQLVAPDHDHEHEGEENVDSQEA